MTNWSLRRSAIAVQDEILVGHVASLDIAAVEEGTDGEAVRQRLDEGGFDRTLVRAADGIVCKFVERSRLRPGPVAETSSRIDIGHVTHASTPILDVVPQVVQQRFLFVAGRRGVGGILTVADLQKVPVRIALFGLITSFEMVARDAMVKHLGDDDPREYLSEKRRKAALELFKMRKERGQELSAIECLQLGDLGTVARRLKLHTLIFGQPSGSALKDEIRRIGDLRDRLAHASDLDLDKLPGTLESLHCILQAASAATA